MAVDRQRRQENCKSKLRVVNAILDDRELKGQKEGCE
jgi:hypothetical protein